jgi:hypothetical protein
VSTQLASVTPGYDTPSDLAGHAAHKLVHFRDGIMRQLLREAELTADEAPSESRNVLVSLLAVLEPADRDRRAYQITHLAGLVWGIFAQIGDDKARTLATLRAVCEDAANAVTHDVRQAACNCKAVTR